MTDIDLNALDLDELKVQAEVLGITFPANIKEDTLRKKIAEALGETAESAPAVKEPATDDKVIVHIARDNENKQPVFLGLNGDPIRVRRGEDVAIPAKYLQCLENAIRLEKDEDTGEMVEIPAYSYTVKLAG